MFLFFKFFIFLYLHNLITFKRPLIKEFRVRVSVSSAVTTPWHDDSSNKGQSQVDMKTFTEFTQLHTLLFKSIWTNKPFATNPLVGWVLLSTLVGYFIPNPVYT